MKTIQITVPAFPKKYPVMIGQNMLSTITQQFDFAEYSSVCIITDTNVSELYLDTVKQAISKEVDAGRIHDFVFAAGEKNKSMETVYEGYKTLVSAKADRRTLVVNVGGGVVSDLGGYTAATFLRGIPYINIPTTLESMVDASVGGKTGVNFGTLKNYIGAFSSPQAIIIDIDTLKTLPERAFIQGYAEVIKHGLIKDLRYFDLVKTKKPTELDTSDMIEIIAGSVHIKAEIVQEDPHEKGIRKILNFGHTIGHVVESLSLKTQHPLFHGEAVAIGMVAEAYISYKEGMISQDEFDEIETSIKSVGLPIRFTTEESMDHIIEMLQTDKKTEKGSIKWSLLEGIGKADFNIMVNDSFMREAIQHILQSK